MTEYFISWCLICGKKIEPECLYCSDTCQLIDFIDIDIDYFTGLRANSTRISSTESMGSDMSLSEDWRALHKAHTLVSAVLEFSRRRAL